MEPGLYYTIFQRDLWNLSLIHSRGFDAWLVTMHQAGTNWLIHQLSVIVAKTHDLPMPADLDEMRLVTRANEKPYYDQIPHIGHTHTIPSWLVHAPPCRMALTYPKTLLLLRDVRASLVACYDRYQYTDDFSVYVRGHSWSNRYRKDIWRDIRFLNAWNRVRRVVPPNEFHVVRYEDMRVDPAAILRQIVDFLEWDVSDEMVALAIAESSKEKMAAKEISSAGRPIVRARKKHSFAWYSDADRAFVTETLERHIDHDFGYDYADWTHPDDVPRAGARPGG